MKNHSRIRFNPGTKEIEIEGNEEFVKTYFDKLQAMISGPSQGAATTEKEPRAVKASPKKRAEKKPKAAKVPRAGKAKAPKKKKPTMAKRAGKAGKKAPAQKRATKFDAVVSLIQGTAEGISTAELKEKTGLAERQIWGIVNRAAKEGKIRKMKRGVYGGAAETGE